MFNPGRVQTGQYLLFSPGREWLGREVGDGIASAIPVTTGGSPHFNCSLAAQLRQQVG